LGVGSKATEFRFEINLCRYRILLAQVEINSWQCPKGAACEGR